MPKIETLIDKYVEFSKEIEKLEQSDTIRSYLSFLEARDSLQDSIKAMAKEIGEGVENKDIKVAVIPVWKKFYSYKDFMKIAKRKEIAELNNNDGLEIKKEVFEKLVQDGAISPATVQASFQEFQSTTRVDIKLKGK